MTFVKKHRIPAVFVAYFIDIGRLVENLKFHIVVEKTKNFFNRHRSITIILITFISFELYLWYGGYTFSDIIQAISSWDSFVILICTWAFWLCIIGDSVIKFLLFVWATNERDFAFRCSIPVYAFFYRIYYVVNDVYVYVRKTLV